jgi:hypothetical protein
MKARPEGGEVGQPEKVGPEIDPVAGQNAGFDDRPGQGRPDGEKRPGPGQSREPFDLGRRRAHEEEALTGAVEERPGLARFGRVSGQPFGPLGGQEIFGLKGQIVRTIDLRQDLAFADPISGDDEDALDRPASGP